VTLIFFCLFFGGIDVNTEELVVCLVKEREDMVDDALLCVFAVTQELWCLNLGCWLVGAGDQ
jgi:hypothetical protein